jgi:hypothetical protein
MSEPSEVPEGLGETAEAVWKFAAHIDYYEVQGKALAIEMLQESVSDSVLTAKAVSRASALSNKALISHPGGVTVRVREDGAMMERYERSKNSPGGSQRSYTIETARIVDREDD